jgi:hypothetical protein
MKDAISGVPDTGTRIILLVIITFILGVTCLLFFMKMREADERIENKKR